MKDHGYPMQADEVVRDTFLSSVRDANRSADELADTRQLHPTKGWRNLNPKRARAQMLMSEIRAGRPMTTAQMGRFIAQG